MGKFILGGISSSQLSTVVLDKKELVYDVDNNQIYYGDGTATGGLPLGITGINASAGTTSNGLTNIVFSNSNGVSFGLNGSTVTASFSGGGGADGINRLAAGTQSAGLTQTVVFGDSNGITFGMSNSSVITASHNGLTTAAQSNHSHNFATTTTNGSVIVVATTDSNGATIAVPSFLTTAQAPGAYLTTAAQSNQVVNSLNGSTGQISLNVGSSLSASTNGSSITFGLASNITTALQSAGAYLTTAALSNHSHNFATTTTNGASIIVATTNSNGATIAVPQFLTTAQPVGAYLTTARASTDGVGLNTAQTNVTWTVNSSGISLNASGYAGIGTSATNASVTLNSNGLAISVAAPGGGGNVVITAGLANTLLEYFLFHCQVLRPPVL